MIKRKTRTRLSIKQTTKQKHPPPKVIAVDVDGTLIIDGEVNAELVDYCRRKKSEGYTMILWSSRGKENAERAAKQSGLEDVFNILMSKPGYIVDDKRWSWTKYTRVVQDYNE